MKKWIEDLLALQETDMRVRKLQSRLEMVPEEKKRLTERLSSEQQALKQSKEKLHKTELDIKGVESQIAKCNDEIKKLQGQSAMVKKNNEYKALMDEIQNWKSKISSFETDEINLLDKVEEDKRESKDLEKKLSEKTKSIESELKELEQLMKELKEEIEKVKAGRSALMSKIDDPILADYKRLLTGKGEPLVMITQGICGNCHLRITPQTINEARKAIPVRCDNCSHLIYLPEAANVE